MVTTSGTATPRTGALLDELVEVFLAEGFREHSLAALAARLRCSKSTLYAIAPSKEQLVVTVVRAFFRRAAERVEDRLSRARSDRRIGTYLLAIAEELAPASERFFADLDAFAPAREIYTRNTQFAADRVRELVREGTTRRGVDATFVGVVAASVMESINAGRIGAATGLDDAAAYRALADLIVSGVSPR